MLKYKITVRCGRKKSTAVVTVKTDVEVMDIAQTMIRNRFAGVTGRTTVNVKRMK